jgi:hypothetical protein
MSPLEALAGAMATYDAAMRAEPRRDPEALERLRQRARVRLYRAVEAVALGGFQLVPLPLEVDGLEAAGLVVEVQ